MSLHKPKCKSIRRSYTSMIDTLMCCHFCSSHTFLRMSFTLVVACRSNWQVINWVPDFTMIHQDKKKNLIFSSIFCKKIRHTPVYRSITVTAHAGNDNRNLICPVNVKHNYNVRHNLNSQMDTGKRKCNPWFWYCGPSLNLHELSVGGHLTDRMDSYLYLLRLFTRKKLE